MKSWDQGNGECGWEGGIYDFMEEWRGTGGLEYEEKERGEGIGVGWDHHKKSPPRSLGKRMEKYRRVTNPISKTK